MSSIARRHLSLVPNGASTRPRYLFSRNGIYYFKRKIPADVAHGFPEYREQVWKSLQTNWLETAKVRLAVEVTEFELKVAQLRREHATQAAAVRLVALPSGSGVLPVAAPGATGPVVAAAAIPRRLTLTALPVASQPAKPSGPERPSMLHLFEDWKRKQTRHRTVNAVEAAVMEFRELHGPLAVEDLTKGHAREYRDSLIARPAYGAQLECNGFAVWLDDPAVLGVIAYVLNVGTVRLHLPALPDKTPRVQARRQDLPAEVIALANGVSRSLLARQKEHAEAQFVRRFTAGLRACFGSDAEAASVVDWYRQKLLPAALKAVPVEQQVNMSLRAAFHRG